MIVGLPLGEVLGASLPEMDGLPLGNTIGKVLGPTLGELLGKALGAVLGATLGVGSLYTASGVGSVNMRLRDDGYALGAPVGSSGCHSGLKTT